MHHRKKDEKVHQLTASPIWGDAIPKPTLMKSGTLGDVTDLINFAPVRFNMLKVFRLAREIAISYT
jgi:hypothetical protein